MNFIDFWKSCTCDVAFLLCAIYHHQSKSKPWKGFHMKIYDHQNNSRKFQTFVISYFDFLAVFVFGKFTSFNWYFHSIKLIYKYMKFKFLKSTCHENFKMVWTISVAQRSQKLWSFEDGARNCRKNKAWHALELRDFFHFLPIFFNFSHHLQI